MMEKELKTPVIILTRDREDGIKLRDHLESQFNEYDMHIVLVSTPEEMMEHLTVKHYNIVIVDYDPELYRRAEELVYEKPDKLAASLMFSSAYDVQFIFRKPSEHVTSTEIRLQPGMEEIIIDDRYDHESAGLMVARLLEQREPRRSYARKNYMMAAALVVFIIFIAILIF